VEKPGDSRLDEDRVEVRDGLGNGGAILCLILGAGCILLFVGLGKQIARDTMPLLLDLPGGPWTAGGGLGIITVLGSIGGMCGAPGVSAGPRSGRHLRALTVALSWALAFGPLFLLLSGLRGRNCDWADCAYIPGTGNAMLAYILGIGAVGWPLRRWSRARAEERSAQERQRIRRLRKRGKGRSRAARHR
jgi:hypothetical protein